MKNIICNKIFLMVVGSFAGAISLAADIAPYEPDDFTPALFPLDEEVAENRAYNVVNNDRAVVIGDLVDGFGLGGESVAGFGKGFIGGVNVIRDIYDQSLMQGDDGAFTYEMIIRVDHLDPLTSGSLNRTLMGWGQGGSSGQIRLSLPEEAGGPLRLTFYNTSHTMNGGVSFSAVLPAAGSHAFVLGKYFHVAFTYDGNEGQAGNFKVYWTALDSGAVEAQRLALVDLDGLPIEPVGMDQTWSELTSTWLLIGANINGSDLNFPGVIDNVRISSVARAPDEFIFYGDPISTGSFITDFGNWVHYTDPALGWIYGVDANWGYSTYLSWVYAPDYPWVYQLRFGWMYHVETTEDYVWFYGYDPDLGWVAVSSGDGGAFWHLPDGANDYIMNDFLNPQ